MQFNTLKEDRRVAKDRQEIIMMTTEKAEQSRLRALEALVLFEEPLKQCVDRLSSFEWDYEGAPFVLKRSHLVNILQRYLADNLSASDVEAWADTLELREDVTYEAENEVWIEQAIYVLANPSLNGAITRDKVTQMLRLR